MVARRIEVRLILLGPVMFSKGGGALLGKGAGLVCVNLYVFCANTDKKQDFEQKKQIGNAMFVYCVTMATKKHVDGRYVTGNSVVCRFGSG